VQATPELIDLAQQILQPQPGQVLVIADSEHFSSQLVHDVKQRTGFDLLVPLPSQPAHRRRWQAIPEEQFTRRWAGFATAKVPYEVQYGQPGQYLEFVERFDERPEEWRFKGFLCTADRDEVDALSQEFPQRWHVEEFFNAHQALARIIHAARSFFDNASDTNPKRKRGNLRRPPRLRFGLVCDRE
jgi:hypothetical protein